MSDTRMPAILGIDLDDLELLLDVVADYRDWEPNSDDDGALRRVEGWLETLITVCGGTVTPREEPEA